MNPQLCDHPLIVRTPPQDGFECGECVLCGLRGELTKETK